MARLALAFCILGLLVCTSAAPGYGSNHGDGEVQVYNKESQEGDNVSGRGAKDEHVSYDDHRGQTDIGSGGGDDGSKGYNINQAHQKAVTNGEGRAENCGKIPNEETQLQESPKSLESNVSDIGSRNENNDDHIVGEPVNGNDNETQSDSKRSNDNIVANDHDNQRRGEVVDGSKINKKDATVENSNYQSDGKSQEHSSSGNERGGTPTNLSEEKGREYNNEKDSRAYNGNGDSVGCKIGIITRIPYKQ